jgi:hypothetical protein
MNSERNKFLSLRLTTCFVYFLFCCTNQAVAKEIWPRLTAETDNPRCLEALKIAESVFYSDSFYISMDDNPDLPQNINSKFALEIKRTGNEYPVVLDSLLFKKIFKYPAQEELVDNKPGFNDYYIHIYWQLNPINKIRLVLDTSPRTWLGVPWYGVYLISETLCIDEFLDKLGAEEGQPEIKPVAQGYQAPLILKDKNMEEFWLINTSPPYIFLGPWEVFAIKDDQAIKICNIEFHPKAEKPKQLMSAEVVKLTQLLKIALGRDSNPGSWNPFANIKLKAKHGIANMAMRPWALRQMRLYNSRTETDKGLKKWSRESRYNHEIYQKILKQYKKAEKALTKYYMEQFDKTYAQARSMAVNALDIIYRAHFCFAKRELR